MTATSIKGQQRTVVVGYSPSELGRAVLSAALAEAKRHEAGLLVLNVTRGDSYTDPHFASEEQLRALEQELASSTVNSQVDQLMGREPAQEIIRAAHESAAVLVVIGLRKRSAVGKFLMGSTAQSVLLEAPCPVLSVKV
ncbi:MAG TPA: universal stress protein [Nocardioidaceae bacterium]|nr:universal stress protein [Nocardioidaceae bacterium]